MTDIPDALIAAQKAEEGRYEIGPSLKHGKSYFAVSTYGTITRYQEHYWSLNRADCERWIARRGVRALLRALPDDPEDRIKLLALADGGEDV